MAHKILEEIIGKNIARYREAAGLTQATLAEKIGISTAFVSRVERGQKKMKVETLYATAKVLNVSVDALLSTESSAAQLANINQPPGFSCFENTSIRRSASWKVS